MCRRRPEERASIDEILQSTLFGSKTGLQRRNTAAGSRELPLDNVPARANSGGSSLRSLATSPVAPGSETVSTSQRQVNLQCMNWLDELSMRNMMSDAVFHLIEHVRVGLIVMLCR